MLWPCQTSGFRSLVEDKKDGKQDIFKGFSWAGVTLNVQLLQEGLPYSWSPVSSKVSSEHQSKRCKQADAVTQSNNLKVTWVSLDFPPKSSQFCLAFFAMSGIQVIGMHWRV